MKLSYVTLCVENLDKMLAFYQAAFALPVKFVHESGQYAEMDTGTTVLAFSQSVLAESLIACGYEKADLTRKPANILIGIDSDNVPETLDAAIRSGATLVADAELKPWGWLSAMVRDPEGNLIEIARQMSD